MNRSRREHPAAIPRRFLLLLWLIFLPLIRGAFDILPDWLTNAIPHRLVGVWLTVTVLLLWWRRTYTLSHHHLILRRGILLHRTTKIPVDLITTLTVEQPLWLRLLGGVRVVADTDAGNHRMADLRLTVHRREMAVFLPDNRRVRFRAAGWRMLLLAVFSSDSLGGFLLLITVLRHGSVLLGEGLRRTVLTNLQTAAEALALIPKTAAVVTLALAAAWLTGTVRLLLRHLPFSVCREKDTLTIHTGWFSRRIHCCAIGAVNYLDRRQTLAAYLLGLHTGYVSCTGYGKDRNTKAVLIPPCRREHARLEERLYLPALARHRLTVQPVKGALWRYLRLPLCLLIGLPSLGWIAAQWFPAWSELITYLTLMATLPCLWLLAVGWVDRRTAGLGYEDGCCCLAYRRFLTLHRVTLPREKVAVIHLRQSLWQRRRGICDVKIFSHHEFRRPHPVRHLPLEKAQTVLDRIK